MEWRCACGFGKILWLLFLIVSALWTWSLFLIWSTIKVYRQWVPCGRNSSYSFLLIVLKLCRCFLHGMKMCMWFCYNTLIIFSHFFYFVSFCLIWDAIKVYGDCGYLVGATLLTVFHQLFWNFDYLFHFFLFVNLDSFFFTWNAIVTHKSTVARTVMCRQDGRGRFRTGFVGRSLQM